MTASIYDVAKRAGVSISTVSRILNNSASVSEKKVLAVQEAMEYYKYEPNQFARGLVKQTSNMIGVYFPEGQGSVFDSNYYLELMKGIESVLPVQNYSMVLLGEKRDYSSRKGRIPKFIEFIKQRRIDGLILSGLSDKIIRAEEFNQIMEEEYPIVYIGKRIHEKGMNVYAQFEQYHMKMIEVLRENGHRKILMYAMDIQDYYLKVIMERVKKELPDMIVYLVYLEVSEDIREQMLISVEQHIIRGGCTAIASMGAQETQLLLSVCAELHLAVPEQVSIISVEHTRNACQLLYPKISAFYVPAKTMGSGAAELLLNSIRGIDLDEKSIEYETKYIERDSIRHL